MDGSLCQTCAALTGTRFSAGKRQNQDLRDFMIWQDCEFSIAVWLASLIINVRVRIYGIL